jgi:hypothetical protein
MTDKELTEGTGEIERVANSLRRMDDGDYVAHVRQLVLQVNAAFRDAHRRKIRPDVVVQQLQAVGEQYPETLVEIMLHRTERLL